MIYIVVFLMEVTIAFSLNKWASFYIIIKKYADKTVNRKKNIKIINIITGLYILASAIEKFIIAI